MFGLGGKVAAVVGGLIIAAAGAGTWLGYKLERDNQANVIRNQQTQIGRLQRKIAGDSATLDSLNTSNSRLSNELTRVSAERDRFEKRLVAASPRRVSPAKPARVAKKPVTRTQQQLKPRTARSQKIICLQKETGKILCPNK